MSRSKNAVRFSDVSTTPIKLKYSASYLDSDFSSVGISIVRGINTPVTSSVKVSQFKINYNLIEQLFYRSYISGSLLGSGSAYDSSYQSTAASGSLDEDVRFFPTQSNSEVVYLYMPRNVFGEQIAKKSFILETPRYKIYDDGNGNLFDEYAGRVKVGNIIYSQAFAIITDPNYICYFINPEFDFVLEEGKIDVIVPSVTPSPSITPSATPSVTITQTPSPTISITPSVTSTPGTSVSVTPSITPSKTVSVTPSVTVTPSVQVSPSNTPSITVSPSPSSNPSYYYYDVTQYLCSDGSQQLNLIMRAASPLTVGKYYRSIQSDSYSYLVNSTSLSESWDIEPVSYIPYNTYSESCSV